MISTTAFDCAGDALPRPHEHCYWLAAGQVLAGVHPGAMAAAAIQACGVTDFIDLTGLRDGPGYDPRPAVRHSHPISDFGVPTVAGMRSTLAAITSAVAAGGVVYLHCRAGIGRTGTVAACLLVAHGYSADAALALLQRKWQVAAQRAHAARTPETQAQRDFVAAWKAVG